MAFTAQEQFKKGEMLMMSMIRNDEAEF